MQIARMIGIIIDFGVPAIMLGGLVFHLSHSWAAVWVFEVVLVAVAVNTAIKVAGKPDPDAAHH
jgi:hypothetical protein